MTRAHAPRQVVDVGQAEGALLRPRVTYSIIMVSRLAKKGAADSLSEYGVKWLSSLLNTPYLAHPPKNLRVVVGCFFPSIICLMCSRSFGQYTSTATTGVTFRGIGRHDVG